MNVPAGSNSFQWNGKNNTDLDVIPGTYTVVAMAIVSGYSPDLSLQHITVVQEAPAQPIPTPQPAPTPQPSDSGDSSQPSSTETTTTEEVTATEQCTESPDISITDPDCEAITYVKDIGAMTGTGTGVFDPTSRLQRDQVAKIALETFGLFTEGSEYCAGSQAFPDAGPGAWSYQYLCRTKTLGTVTGYQSGPDAGYYLPGNLVNRAEFLAIILRNLDENMPTGGANYSDVSTEQWFSNYARYSFANNLFPGSNLQPTDAVTRREVAQVLYRLHTLGKI